MKNFVKEGQKLPLFGVGPYIVYGMAAVTAAGIIIFAYIFCGQTPSILLHY